MSDVKQFVSRHPRLTAWAVLAIGMVAILAWSARDVGLLWTQWIALIAATIGLAGLCVWIIGWEEEDEDRNVPQAEPSVEVEVEAK
jgi:protein-S-isoprenylcysteine O-methyltransferase Ste14